MKHMDNRKAVFDSELFRCLVFNFLLGLICLIMVTVALRFDFPYSDKPGNYSDWVLPKLEIMMTMSCVWNMFYFIKMCRDAKRSDKQDGKSQ